ncbi:MAG: BrnT family toxin [Bacteroidetes bacterium]|nr:BrnT family toxin [Bacteroidota bacterium]
MEKIFNWNDAKNMQLIQYQDVSFEEVVYCIQNKQILAIDDHPNQKKYPNQRIYVIQMNDYVYLVPFVESDNEIFLKTIIPSRKAKKFYEGGSNET